MHRREFADGLNSSVVQEQLWPQPESTTEWWTRHRKSLKTVFHLFQTSTTSAPAEGTLRHQGPQAARTRTAEQMLQEPVSRHRDTEEQFPSPPQLTVKLQD